jgi:hypothetical protein
LNGERDLGIAGRIAGHDIRVVQRPANLADLNASLVELRLDDAPGVALEVLRAVSLNPNIGMIQRLENRVLKLPDEVASREQTLSAARQEVADAREALTAPFRHQDALEAARWEVERIDRQMRGEDQPQPTLDAELEVLKKQMRAQFPTASGAEPARGHVARVPALEGAAAVGLQPPTGRDESLEI